MGDHCAIWKYNHHDWERRGYVDNGLFVGLWQGQWNIGTWRTWWFEVETRETVVLSPGGMEMRGVVSDELSYWMVALGPEYAGIGEDREYWLEVTS